MRIAEKESWKKAGVDEVTLWMYNLFHMAAASKVPVGSSFWKLQLVFIGDLISELDRLA